MFRIEIDAKTIKALSAEARVRILKILRGNRRIAADISKELGLAPSTVNEHLKVMEGSGLVKKNETGHKWIYYEITEKGKTLIAPKVPVSIVLVLSLGIGMVLFGGASLFSANVLYSGSGAVQSIMEKAPAIAEQAAGASAPAINWLPLATLAAGAALVVFGFVKLRKK